MGAKKGSNNYQVQ